MEYYENRRRRTFETLEILDFIPFPSVDATSPAQLLTRCPKASQTPLIQSAALAERAQVGAVFVKDERARMGLGSFKALGAAYVIACDAEKGTAKGQTYVTASAGNHGLSVAAGAAAFGSQAVIFLSEAVPETFAARLRAFGADVRRAGNTYEESMVAAEDEAQRNGWILLSDSSWPDYIDRPRILMEGYLILMQEVASQMAETPTHIFLQAGVGGLAAACAGYARKVWGPQTLIVVVEPEAAPALFASVKAGSPQVTVGPISSMGRLDCKEPSLIALKGLVRDASGFMTITEDEGRIGNDACAKANLPSTPSGAAGVAGLLAAVGNSTSLELDKGSRVLVILSEEASD